MNPLFARVGVIGAGAMGRGIAQIAAQSGSVVQMFDMQAQACATAQSSVFAQWDKLGEKGRMSAEQIAQCKARLRCAESLQALSECTLVIEAVVERLDVKAALQAAPPDQQLGWIDGSESIEIHGMIERVPSLRTSLPQLVSAAWALTVSCVASTLLCAAFLDATRAWRGQRRVLNISSGLGRRAMAGSALYCAAKAGMDHLSRSLALEEESVPNGARVVSLAPGVIDTDMQVQLRGADAAAFPERERFAALHREGRLTSAEEAAARVLACLERADFGTQPVADVRELA